jgi:hypothetical protein
MGAEKRETISTRKMHAQRVRRDTHREQHRHTHRQTYTPPTQGQEPTQAQ